MFAVIRTDGRQFRVAANDVIELSRIGVPVGERVEFPDVLMLGGPDGTTLGAPTVAGASVAGEVLEHPRGKKIIVFKLRRRHNYRRTKGHRQDLTLVRITDILTDGQKAPDRPAGSARRAPPKAASTKDLPRLFDAPAGAADDLKLIVGVGPILEQRLNAIGITRFDQVAALTADEIAKIDETLAFRGRIDREGWVSQAADLAAKTGSKA